MAMIIPTGASTFRDLTSTEEGHLHKYVLIQILSDGDLEWVPELRARLVKDELKYCDFKIAHLGLREPMPYSISDRRTELLPRTRYSGRLRRLPCWRN